MILRNGLNFRLGLSLLASGLLAASVCAQSLTPGVDQHTVAFWPLDEPQYVNMTLTDAGPSHYDLRLRHGGRMTPGRFGNALAISTQTLPACMFAEIAGIHSSPDLTSRPNDPPTRILEALAGPEWTWECWVQLHEPTHAEAALLHLTTAGKDTFYCAVAPGSDALILRDWNGVTHLRLPIAKSNLGDSQWHHLALVKSGAPTTYALYVDGVRQAAGEPIATERPPSGNDLPDFSSGLIGVLYGCTDLTKPHKIEVNHMFDVSFSVSRGGDWLEPDRFWAEQWRGLIEGPVTGTVQFRAVASDGVRLRVNNQLIIDGWGRETERAGTVSMTQGKRIPILVDFMKRHTEQPHLSLYWSWPGHPEELVPPGALVYTPEHAREVAAIMDVPTSSSTRPFELRIGTTAEGLLPLGGKVDELRFSSTARYGADGPPPASFTYNYGPQAPAPSRPNGPPLLFASDGAASEPLALGDRKHLFIDDAILAEKQHLVLAPNAWLRRERVNIKAEGDIGVYDVDGQVRLLTTSGEQWRGIPEVRNATMLMHTSVDGLNFIPSDRGLPDPHQPGVNNAMIRGPVQGQVFEDPNPATPAAARFKYTCYYMTRGQYLYYSPDGIHWTRNETIMEPFDCGGGVETFWDDQRGEYFSYIRNETWVSRSSAYGRASALARTREPFKPWPFTPVLDPRLLVSYPGWSVPSMGRELPITIIPDERGHVYRARTTKYTWAPDTYLAFVWRGGASGPHNKDGSSCRTDLGVSRDGIEWKYTDPWCIADGEDLGGGEVVHSAVCAMGIVRRGDELWNYASIGTRTPSGEEGPQTGFYRFAQRLDGYVSLDAGATMGTATTKAFTFAGDKLIVNVNASSGQLRVGLLNADGSPIKGFALGDCVPVTADATAATVTWAGQPDLAAIAGKPVRMQLELTNAKLYAFQFGS